MTAMTKSIPAKLPKKENEPVFQEVDHANTTVEEGSFPGTGIWVSPA
jgi:hypothetical protein